MFKPQRYATIYRTAAVDRNGYYCVEIKAKITEGYITETLTAIAPIDYLKGHFEDGYGPSSLLGREVLLKIDTPEPASYSMRELQGVQLTEKRALLYFVNRISRNVLLDHAVPLADYILEIEDNTPKPRQYVGGDYIHQTFGKMPPFVLPHRGGKSELMRILIDKMRAEGHTIYAIPKASMNADEPFKYPPDRAQPWSNKAMRTFQNGINSEAQTAINAAENGIKALENIISSKSLKIGQLEGQRERDGGSYAELKRRTDAAIASLQGEVDKLRQSNSDKRKRIKELQDTLDKSGKVATLNTRLEGNTDAGNVRQNYIDLVSRIAEALGLSGAVTNDSIVAAVKAKQKENESLISACHSHMDFRKAVATHFGLPDFAANEGILLALQEMQQKAALAENNSEYTKRLQTFRDQMARELGVELHAANYTIGEALQKVLQAGRVSQKFRNDVVAALSIGGWMSDAVIVDHCKNVARNAKSYAELRATFDKIG